MKAGLSLVVICLLCSAFNSFSQTWTGSVSSDWNVAANWSPSTVPGTESSVYISNASAPHDPILQGDVTISSLNMTHGILKLNGFAITCSNGASLTGDSLSNGKIVAGDFTQVQNMRMGGKIILEKLDPATNNSWVGGNKVYQDSLLILWHGGRLVLESSSPDSIFADFKIKLFAGEVQPSNNHYLYVKNDMIIDNSGGGTIHFGYVGMPNTTIDGNLVAMNFAGNHSPLFLTNVFVHGNSSNGTFYCGQANISACNINGDFSLVSDSSESALVINSTFTGTDNLFQSGNLTVQLCTIGKIGEGTTILRAANNSNGTGYFRDGTNRFLGNVRFEAFSVAGGSMFLEQTYGGRDSCFGNMILSLSGNSGANLAGNNLYLYKSLAFENNGTGNIVHDNAASAIYFLGSDTSNFSCSGTGSAPSILNIVVNRSGGVRLLSPMQCTNLALTRGIIIASLSNPLEITETGGATGGSDSGYVDGPVIKTGSNAFTFPLGKNNVYAPIAISVPSLSTDQFRAQYFAYPSWLDGYDSAAHDVSLNHVSRREYWLLDRIAGSSNVKVTLSWNSSRSGIINAAADLRVARWNGSSWKDEGTGGTTGTTFNGTIESQNNISSFSPFTLASSSSVNPLPVSYLFFTALLQGDQTVLLKWKIGSAANLDRFELERSIDGRSWATISNLLSQPLSEYSYLDRSPAIGLNYYRIRQVDQDGRSSYSSIRTVLVKQSGKIYIWPNPATDRLFIQCLFTKASAEIMDMSGKLITRHDINNSLTTINIIDLKSGVYLVRILYDGGQTIERFIKQ